MRTYGYALIADMVRSRSYADRKQAHVQLVRALNETNREIHHLQPLAPTVGDESQGLYSTLNEAVEATLRLRLRLPAPLDCRFGIGVGWVEPVGDDTEKIQDGSAWWSAREAIIKTKGLEDRGKHALSGLRTWVTTAGDAQESLDDEARTNAYLLCRDQIISRMTERQRRIAFLLLAGQSQAEIAEIEDVTEAAISQGLRRSGATTLIESARLLGQVSR